jgi:hypothetical protein
MNATEKWDVFWFSAVLLSLPAVMLALTLST